MEPVLVDRGVSIQDLHERYDYNPDTGVMVFKKPSGSAKAGAIVKGFPNTKDYLLIEIKGKKFLLARVIFALMEGRWPWPGYFVDHRDRDKRNHRWKNLREASSQESGFNRKLRSDNPTGYKRVKKTKSGRYSSSIAKAGKSLRLGTFDTAEEAYAAYCQAAKELHGEFACLG